MSDESRSSGEHERRSSRSDNDTLGRWLRRASYSEIVAVVGLVSALLFTLGWRRFDAEFAIRREERARTISDSVFAVQMLEMRRRVDSLANQLWFTNFLQCINTVEQKRPPACTPILQRGPYP